MKKILFSALAMSLSTLVFANGNHAGGHGDATAYGKPGVAAKVSRTIELVMSDDMRYSMSDIKVKKGGTVELFFVPVKKGSFEVICTIDDHKEKGMVGGITVE